MGLTTGRGPLSSDPAGTFSQPIPAGVVLVEPHPGRIEAVPDGATVLDTERALIVHRPDSTSAYAFLPEDVGDLPHEPEPEAPGYVRVPWDAVDQWREEGRVLVHCPPNPYHRVDYRATNRRLRVEIGDVVLVDTDDTVILFETALDPVMYVAPEHVRTDLLQRTDTTSYCNYKGWTTCWSATVGDTVVEDLAWSYEDPFPESSPVKGYFSFDPAKAKVDAALPPTRGEPAMTRNPTFDRAGRPELEEPLRCQRRAAPPPKGADTTMPPTGGGSSTSSGSSRSDPELTTGDVHDLAVLLEVEALEPGRFRGQNAAHGAPRPTVYGGQAVAQALRAAAHTVPPDRPPHSLHCYFLRRVRADRPVDYLVDLSFDGGRSSARQVRGVQDDELFFSMIVSFRAGDDGPTFDWTSRRGAPPPETLAPGGWDRLVDVREISAGRIGDHVVPDHMWCRVATPLPDEPIVHSCAIAYVSDYGGAFAALDVSGLPPGGATVDHVLRFHQPARADDWMRIDLAPERVSQDRGSYTGTISDRHGAIGTDAARMPHALGA